MAEIRETLGKIPATNEEKSSVDCCYLFILHLWCYSYAIIFSFSVAKEMFSHTRGGPQSPSAVDSGRDAARAFRRRGQGCQ